MDARGERMSSIRRITYPTNDGKPFAESQIHGEVMIDVIQTLVDRFADDPNVHVWGNLLMFYEEGDPRKHLAPDVFFVRGVPKLPPRLHYLIWKEGKGPDVVIEITSKTTRREDQNKKLVLYRDVLKVPEYFQFDPTEDYLKPSLQGCRLMDGEYVPIAPVAGRLPSMSLGLHLERDGTELRLFDPVEGKRLPTRLERANQADAERRSLEAETDRLRREVAALRKRLDQTPGT